MEYKSYDNQLDNNIEKQELPSKNLNKILEDVIPNTQQRNIAISRRNYIGNSIPTGILGSVGDSIKLAGLDVAGLSYKGVHSFKQDILRELPNHSGYDWGDSIERARLDILREDQPNQNIVMAGGLATNIAAFAAATALTGGVADVVGGAASALRSTNAIEKGLSTVSKFSKANEDFDEAGTIVSSNSINAQRINKANELRDISNPKHGIVRRFATYGALTTPFSYLDNVHFNSKGETYENLKGFGEETALNTAIFGSLEGVTALHRILTTHNSQVSQIGSKEKEVYDNLKKETTPNENSTMPKTYKENEVPEAIEKDVVQNNIKENHEILLDSNTTDTIPEKDHVMDKAEKIVKDNVNNSSTNKELINASFTEDQIKKINNDVLNPRINLAESKFDFDLKDQTSLDLQKVMSDRALTKVQKRQLSRALLARDGVLYNDKNVSLSDPLIASDISINMAKVKDYNNLSGSRKVLYTDEFLKQPYSKVNDYLATKLFRKNTYRNTASINKINNDGEYIAQPYKGGSKITHNYPKWWLEADNNSNDIKALNLLNSEVAKGNKGALYLHALQEEGHKKDVYYHTEALFKHIDDSIKDPMEKQDSLRLLDNYKNNEGMFKERYFTDEEKKMSKDLLDTININIEKFSDIDNKEYFTKIIKKLRDNKIATEKYIICMLGNV